MKKQIESTNKESDAALNSEALKFLEEQQITPNFYAEMIIRAVKHGAKWQKQLFINKAISFFEEYLTEEYCKFGSSEWTEVKSKFESLDDFINTFKNYINKN